MTKIGQEWLGARVRDMVTGFSGIVTTVADHLTGCRRAWIEGLADEKGVSPGFWIDVSRLEMMEAGAVMVRGEDVSAFPSPSDCGPPR